MDNDNKMVYLLLFIVFFSGLMCGALSALIIMLAIGASL
jgi:hypothetical protein